MRERVDCSLAELDAYLRLTEDEDGPNAISEICLVKTCNRVELYAAFDEGKDGAPRALFNVLTRGDQIVRREIRDHAYWFDGADAIEHLCRVTTGLDSLVLGEAQILGQVTQGHMTAVKLGTLGPTLRRAFQAGIRAGKRSRTETTIGAKNISMSSVSISLSQEVVGDLHKRRIAVVGLGEMGMMSLKALRAREIKNVDVVNRSVERAKEVGSKWGYQPHGLEDLPLILREADVVLTATASTEPIIGPEMLTPILAERESPLVLIDISVPRNVDADVKEMSGVRLFDTGDLTASLDEGFSARQREVPRVESIIKEEVHAYVSGVNDPTMGPVIADLRQKAEDIRRKEIERTLKQIGASDPDMTRHIQRLSRSLVNKLLHEPTARLKDGGDKNRESYAETVRALFGLTRRTREPK